MSQPVFRASIVPLLTCVLLLSACDALGEPKGPLPELQVTVNNHQPSVDVGSHCAYGGCTSVDRDTGQLQVVKISPEESVEVTMDLDIDDLQLALEVCALSVEDECRASDSYEPDPGEPLTLELDSARYDRYIFVVDAQGAEVSDATYEWVVDRK